MFFANITIQIVLGKISVYNKYIIFAAFRCIAESIISDISQNEIVNSIARLAEVTTILYGGFFLFPL